MINAGAMRYQVRIESRSSVQDSAGEPELIWQSFASRRAELARTPGREIFAQGREARVPTVWKLRFLDGVTPGMRLLCRGKVYDIISAIDPDGRRAETVITSQELVGTPP